MAKMFRRGRKITTLKELLEILEGGEYVSFQGKVKHPEVLRQMTLSFLEERVKAGVIFRTRLKKQNQSA